MELSAKEILKMVEQAGNIRDVLDRKSEFDAMISRYEAVEDKLKKFGNIDDLLIHFKELEDRIYICKHYMNTDEASAYLSINKRTLLNAAQRGDLPYYNPPSKYYYFEKDDLDKWVATFRNPSRQELMAL